MKTPTNYFLRILCILFGASFLVACGSGGNSGNGSDDLDDSGTNPDNNGNPSTPIRTVSAGSPLSDTVASDEYNLYKVPSDSQVVLTVNSGYASLYLYTSPDLDSDSLECSSRFGIGETSCSATASNGELYAQVYGDVASSYTINATFDCSVPAINQWVDRNMHDYYLYADQVPVVNPDTYDSPEALIADLRFNSLDPYSSVRDAQSQADFSEQGIVRSFGFSWLRDNAGGARISTVYDDSPFGRAGVKRGDTIVAVNGELWNELNNERYRELIGTNENPLTTTWTFIDNDTGENKDITARLEEFTVNTVLHSQRLTHPDYSGSIGYIMFRSFIETSEAELETVFRDFKDAGVSDLILDLRYNGGGRTRIAHLLASKIAGPLTDNELLVTYTYNDNYSSNNFSRFFAPESNALGLSRLIVITSDRTASSSELVINSLRPYIEVITVGSLTEGKPYISGQNNFCGKTLNAMEAQGVNRNGVSVAGGIAADCYAADDVTRDFGFNSDTSELEGMLRSAANYLVFGTCDASPSSKLASKPLPADTDIAQEDEYVSENAR